MCARTPALFRLSSIDENKAVPALVSFLPSPSSSVHARTPPSPAMSTKLAYKVGKFESAPRASAARRRPPHRPLAAGRPHHVFAPPSDPIRPATGVCNLHLRPTARTRFFRASRSDASIVHRDTWFLNFEKRPIYSAWLNLFCDLNYLRTRHKNWMCVSCFTSRSVGRTDGRTDGMRQPLWKNKCRHSRNSEGRLVVM